MRRRHLYSVFVLAALLCCGITASAETGGSYSSYAPYSIFGVGDLATPGSAYNRTMGGVGIASRNNRFLNFINPAAVTARDSLAFMSDYSIFENNKILRQGDRMSANNTFNINNIAISFPIYRSSAMMLGIRPYSSTGYGYGYYETKPEVIDAGGVTAHTYSGQGSIYQVFATAGVTFFKRLSIGAEYIHYFGNTQKTYTENFTDAATIGIEKNSTLQLSANTFKFGLQYEQHLGNKWTVGVGGTYLMPATLGGYSINTTKNGETTISSVNDTLKVSTNPVVLASEIGVGISVNYMDKFRFEVDYTRSDWGNSGFEAAPGFAVNAPGGAPMFTSSVSEAFRVGFEYVPNRNDIRYYFKKVAYRAGAFYKTDYYCIYGQPVVSRGITFGVTLPVFKWYNGLSIGVELGQRGSIQNNLIRESYCGISFGVNLFDIWFLRRQYE